MKTNEYLPSINGFPEAPSPLNRAARTKKLAKSKVLLTRAEEKTRGRTPKRVLDPYYVNNKTVKFFFLAIQGPQYFPEALHLCIRSKQELTPPPPPPA